MSALEFIVAIKWPATILTMAVVLLAILRWSSGTRQAISIWLGQRNVRVNLAGQEIEATLAETQGSMDLAAGNDNELAGTVALAEPISDGTDQLAPFAPEAVELLRRAAVENIVNSAVRLGWQWSRQGGAEPEVTVSWTSEGHPTVSLAPTSPSSSSPGPNALTLRATGVTSEADARVAVRILLNAFNRHNDEVVSQNQEMWAAIGRRLRRARGGESSGEVSVGETERG
ncbi:hypothetical protein [Streptomyces sp. NPDC020983]|uniref:hypothetical protein n=1 Tax=Streptomyces sp. NPDC020983 TaxID=3365106 RepID=UPI0037B7CF26